MAGTPLKKLLASLETPAPIPSFTEPIETIHFVIHNGDREENLEVEGAAPFHTLEDLKRFAWLQSNQDDDLQPDYCFCAFEVNGDFQSTLQNFVDTAENGTPIQLSDPREVIGGNQIQTTFVNSDGQKNPTVEPRMRNRVTLEDAFLIPFGEVPTIHLYPFRNLLNLAKVPRPISQRDWQGLFYPQFPNLTPTTTGNLTPDDVRQAKALAQQTEAKLQQTRILNDLLSVVTPSELKTTGIRLLTLQWSNKEREAVFEGVEALFFGSAVNEKRPYMRILSPNTTPMTKLYQPDPLQPPQVHDATLLKTWTQEPNPVATESILFIKGLLREEQYGLRPLFGTLRIADDTTADFTIQPPKEQRILDPRKDLVGLAESLEVIAEGMPFALQEAKLGKANINVDLTFDTMPSKNLRKQIAKRMEALNTLFQPIALPQDEQKAFSAYRQKGVSNFKTESRIHAYLTYMFGKKGFEQGDETRLKSQLAREFEISEDEALAEIGSQIDKKTEVTTTDIEGKEFLVLDNPGVDISFASTNVNTFTFQFFNIRAIQIEDFLRICTMLSLVFQGTEEQWAEALGEEDITPVDLEKTAKAAIEVEAHALEEEDAAGEAKAETGFLVNLGEVEEAEEVEVAEAATKGVLPSTKAPGILASDVAATASEGQGKILADHWQIQQLQRLDPVLFNQTANKTAGERPQTGRCAANEDRQPAPLTETQQQLMRRIYAPDEAAGRVGFIVQGVPNTLKQIKDADGKTEKISVLRYGSNARNLFQFLCARIFCLRDLLPILEEDWLSREDRNKKPKPERSCPFCHGRLIINKSKPAEGETVLIRKNKPKDIKPHQWIGFLRKAEHPQGYGLPCCFVSEQKIDQSDKVFTAIREASKDVPVASASDAVTVAKIRAAEERSAELEDAQKTRIQLIVSYDALRWKLNKEYVLGPEKYPLEPGKIGMPSLNLDAQFGQDSTSQVARSAIKQEFKPNAHGFFRLGVMNKPTAVNQSLFAALAPLLGKNTIMSVAKHFTDLITPRVFLHLNFGNLCLEFFDPTDPEFPVPPDAVLATWSQKHLLQPMKDTKFEVSRLYRSQHRFMKQVNDPSQKKLLRHFAHALAEPNLLAPNGLTIVTLHQKGDPRGTATDVEVLCPMLGFDIARQANNTVGFLSQSDAGIYEPFVQVDMLSQTLTARAEGFYVITQQQMEEPTFPRVVRDRQVEEFLTKCRSAYRGAFTLQSHIDNRILVPVTKALEILRPDEPVGLVRDVYNHLVAITVKSPQRGSTREIIVPVVDDGNSFHLNTALKIHMGIQSIPLATANEVYDLYRTKITPRLAGISSVQTLDSFLRTNTIVGFRLGGPDTQATILLPCAANPDDSAQNIPDDMIEQLEGDDTFTFEQELNHKIQTAESDTLQETQPESPFLVSKKQADIIQEHLRLSFANWIATTESAATRAFVDDLVTHKPWIRKPMISNEEKMRRLELELGPRLREWFVMDKEPIDTTKVLLRSDCIAIQDDEGRCSKVCKMKDGKCRIHAPDEVDIRSTPSPKKQTAAVQFVNRLFDELVRLPAKRNELLTKHVKRIQVPTTNIHIGNEWILPESTAAWQDLLRESNGTHGREKPRYQEEMSRSEMSEKEEEELASVKRLYPLPESLAAELSVEARSALQVEVIGPKNAKRSDVLLRQFGIPVTGDKSEIDLTPLLLDISKKTKTPIIQVQVSGTPITVVGRSDGSVFTPKSAAYVIIPDFEEGPAILVNMNDTTDTIPGSLLRGKLQDSIQPMRRILRKRVAVETTAVTEKPATETEATLKESEPEPEKEIVPEPVLRRVVRITQTRKNSNNKKVNTRAEPALRRSITIRKPKTALPPIPENASTEL